MPSTPSARLTAASATVVMTFVADKPEDQGMQPLNVALCVDGHALDRFGRVLRHLLVGLIDQTAKLRLVSSDPRTESLAFGPVQALVLPPIRWPMTGRRIAQFVEALSPHPPTIVHALSGTSYRVGAALAEAFDADLVLQVTSLKDCATVAHLDTKHVGRFLALSPPLAAAIHERAEISEERIDLVRPGVLVSPRAACYAEAERLPTILCLSALERRSGVDRLLEAVHLLRKRGHAFLLFLLGRGRHEVSLRRIIQDRRLSAYVTLANPAGDPTQVMNSADIFVRPSADTSFVADVLQAMGAGMAVVTLASTVCDYLRDGETVLLCDRPSAESLADALERLITDRAEAQRLATTAMEYVRSNHPVSAMAEQTADAYRKLALARATFPIKE